MMGRVVVDEQPLYLSGGPFPPSDKLDGLRDNVALLKQFPEALLGTDEG